MPKVEEAQTQKWKKHRRKSGRSMDTKVEDAQTQKWKKYGHKSGRSIDAKVEEAQTQNSKGKFLCDAFAAQPTQTLKKTLSVRSQNDEIKLLY